VHCHLIADQAQEEALSPFLHSPAYFVQAYIPGEREYATHLVFRNKQVVCSLEIEYVFGTQTPIKLQDEFKYTRIRECPHLDLFASVLESIGFEGLCCLNYKYHGGRPWIFEVNPRMGGSLRLFFFSFLRHL
jgi:carbamoylphosphate synthase large subunit